MHIVMDLGIYAIMRYKYFLKVQIYPYSLVFVHFFDLEKPL